MAYNIRYTFLKPFAILLLIFAYCLTGFGQIVKEQIGTSVWTKDGKVFADSAISYIISFDNQKRKTKEWQVYRDLNGEIKDTNYAFVNIFDKPTHQYGGREHWYTEFDSLGTEIKIIAYRPKDTLVYTYHPEYNDKMKLIRKTLTYNGELGYFPITYTYKGRTTIENQNDGLVITTEKRNKLNQIIYIKTITNFQGDKNTDIIKYKRDSKGNVLLYTKVINGKQFKKTTHYFKNGMEQYQIEQFYNPNYTITTTFKYEFWQ